MEAGFEQYRNRTIVQILQTFADSYENNTPAQYLVSWLFLNKNIGSVDYQLDFYQFKPFLLSSPPNIIREQKLETQKWNVVKDLSYTTSSIYNKCVRTRWISVMWVCISWTMCNWEDQDMWLLKSSNVCHHLGWINWHSITSFNDTTTSFLSCRPTGTNKLGNGNGLICNPT